MRFWGVKHIPYKVLEFCYGNESSTWKDVLIENHIFECAVFTMAFDDQKQFSLELALLTDRPEFVSFWLDKNDCNIVHAKNAITHACRYGRLDLVQTLREKGFPWDENAYCAAAQYGHLMVLEYLHEIDCPINGKAFVYAARGGQIECVKFLHSIGCPWDKHMTCEYALPAHYETITCSEQLFGSKPPWRDDFSNTPSIDVCFQCLQYALENGCLIHDHACSRAARYGLIGCLQLLHQYGAMWNNLSAAAASECGHLPCLQYLYENGCAWDSNSVLKAVQHGHIDCLIYLHKNGCPWDFRSAILAAEGGHLLCLQYLHEHNCPWDSGAMMAAAKYGHLNCIMYLYEHGCPWNGNVVLTAATNNHIHCLQYLQDKCCPGGVKNVFTSEQECIPAANERIEGNSDITKFLMEERRSVRLTNRRIKGQSI